MYVYYSVHVHVHVSYSAKCIGNFYLLIIILMLNKKQVWKNWGD